MTMLRTIDVRAAAALEAARIAAARAIARPDDRPARDWLAGRRPWIARSRSGRRRSSLRGGAVLIWRVAVEDSCGRVAAASLVAMRVVPRAWAAARTPRAIAVTLFAQLRSHPPESVASVLRQRTEEIVAEARAFANARLSRERAVAARCVSRRTEAADFQPGLFDRRAERAWLAAVAENSQRGDAAAARVASAAAAADLVGAQPELLLVLLG